MNEEVYIANRQIKYNGKVHQRGDEVELINGPFDLKLLSDGYITAIDKSVYEKMQEKGKEEKSSPVPPALQKKLDGVGMTFEEVSALTDDEILALSGFGPKMLQAIREV